VERTEARQGGGTSFDLLVVVVAAAVGLGFLAIPALSGLWFLRVPVGVALVLFLPGYAFVSALLPRAGRLRSCNGDRAADGPVFTGRTRVVLGLGLSAGSAPLVGIVIGQTRFGVDPYPTLVALGVITILLSVVAAGRRRRAGEDRYGVSFRRGAGQLRAAITRGHEREIVLNLLLLTGVVVAVAGLGFAVATSDNGERYTEFYVLAEDPATGDLVADDYPETVVAGDPVELHLGIANRERRQVTYTVVVQLQRLEGPADDQTVAERSELGSFRVTVRDGRTLERPHTVEPVLRGEELRLTYLLYVGDPPANPGTGTAYRSLHLWIDVVPPDEES